MICYGHISSVDDDQSYIVASPKNKIIKYTLRIDHDCEELGPKQRVWIKTLGRIVKLNITKNEDDSLELDSITFPRGKNMTQEEHQNVMNQTEKLFKGISWE